MKGKQAPTRNEVTWAVGGEAGYGVKVTGSMFGLTASRAGLRVFDYTEYPSLIRGGYNNYRVEVSETEVRSVPEGLDILVALNEDTIKQNGDDLEDGGVIIYDASLFSPDGKKFAKRNIQLYGVPFKKIAIEVAGNELMKNTVALGVSIGLLGIDFAYLKSVINDTFDRKGKKVVQVNIDTAKKGYEYAKKFNSKQCNFCLRPRPKSPDRMMINGSQAAALGAVAGGVKFYAGYPMTPSTPLLQNLAAMQKKYDIVVHQAEDEITAINATIGSAYTGTRAMTGSSGGGFALMTEALGLAAITETPIVIYLASRPGPATGLPTWTGQGDLQFAIHAAQDEFPRIIIAPGDVEECFYGTADALNLAEKYQLPVFVMTDKFLAESAKNVEPFDDSKVTIDRGKLMEQSALTEKVDFFPRYEDTKDGVSRRTIPGQKNGIHIANSDESDEFGLVNETSENRIIMQDKRFRKLKEIEKDLPKPKLYGPKDADLTIIAWGSLKGPVLDAMDVLKKEGYAVNLLHIMYVYPFPSAAVAKVLEKTQQTLIIENNKTAQLAALMRECLPSYPCNDMLLKYDGRPFFLEDITNTIRETITPRKK